MRASAAIGTSFSKATGRLSAPFVTPEPHHAMTTGLPFAIQLDNSNSRLNSHTTNTRMSSHAIRRSTASLSCARIMHLVLRTRRRRLTTTAPFATRPDRIFRQHRTEAGSMELFQTCLLLSLRQETIHPVSIVTGNPNSRSRRTVMAATSLRLLTTLSTLRHEYR